MRFLLPLLVLVLAACNDAAFTSLNAAPIVELLTPADGEEVREATTLLLRGSVSDPDDVPDSLTARWYVGDEAACPASAPARDGTVECTIIAPSSAFTVLLEGRDSQGAAASASIGLRVVDDLSPSVTITAPGAAAPQYRDRPVLLEGLVADPENVPSELAVRWVSSRDGELVDAATVAEDGVVHGYASLSEGVHALQLFAVDTAGNESVDDVVLTVGPPDTAPTCAIASPVDGGVGVRGDELLFAGTVADAELAPGELSIRWESSLDGVLGVDPATAGGAVGLTTASLAIGLHELALTATDELGLSCTESIVFTVDTPPTLMFVAPADGSVSNGGDEIVFLAGVSDAEDAPEALWVAWVSDVDGLLAEGYADGGGRAVISHSELSVGEHTVTATVTDSVGLAGSGAATFRVNGLPAAPSVSLVPASPVTPDDLVVAIDLPALDPEGDPLTYGYAWSVDGAASAASITDTLPAWATARGETWTVEVWAADPWGAGPAGSSSATVANSAPTLASVDITPDPATRADTLVCTPNGYSDDDGDPDATTFTWSVNGSTVATTPALSGAFVTGDLVICAVTPFDGTDGGLTLYDSVMIQNSAPIVDSVSLTPTVAYTDDTVAVTVVSHDDEGDAVSLAYRWTVDGVVVATSGTSLDGVTAFVKHQVVAVEVTPSDSDGAGTPVSASVTVSNTPPTAPGLDLDPAAPQEGDALLCEVATAGVDADGDAVSYAMAWTVDGAAYPAAADVGPSTVTWSDDEASAADTEAYELYECSATPDDGEDIGTPGTVSVEVERADTRVFVTSGNFTGGFGGVSGADAECQDAADTAGLGGTWIAFLSDSSQAAGSRIADGPYVLLDGTTVASSRADLLDGALSTAIHLDEYGASQSKWVFTGSTTAGSSAASGSSVNGLCSDWTNGCGVCYGNHFYATSGRSYDTNSAWTNAGWLFCSQSSGLYCFEQ
ncbi:MAG: hypothetical protein EXR71_11750 [Myxococcales bacterium]|nr:hypothetical protein [Myxococcales bacterium]